jgi:hypothetical protein
MTSQGNNYWNATSDLSLIADGNYTIRINATDSSGNSNITQNTSGYLIGIDRVLPLLSNLSFYNPVWLGDPQNISVDASDAFSGISWVNISVPGESIDNQTMNESYWYTFILTKTNKTQNFTIYAWDSAGNVNITLGNYTCRRNGTMNFSRAGANLFSLPVEEWNYKRVNDFGSFLYSQGLRFDLISKWDRDKKKWISQVFINGVGLTSEKNFLMEPGHGYFINTTNTKEITRAGGTLPSITNVLKQEYNLIGVRENRTAGGICNSIGLNCTEIWKMNLTMKGHLPYEEQFDKFNPIAPGTNNYTMVVETGYWVYVNTTQVNWSW